MRLLFLGVGNRDRGDDAIGPLVAEALQADAALLDAGMEILPHSGEGASLMDLWEGLDRVVVVDAMKSGSPVGTVHQFEATETPLETGYFHYSSHLFSLAEAVEMARALGRLPTSLVIFGVEGACYDFGTALSPPVSLALPKLVADVRAALLAEG